MGKAQVKARRLFHQVRGLPQRKGGFGLTSFYLSLVIAYWGGSWCYFCWGEVHRFMLLRGAIGQSFGGVGSVWQCLFIFGGNEGGIPFTSFGSVQFVEGGQGQGLSV